eukprot:TRINITY_DN5739_c0_g1_i10.p2 TRINITY_DN5739_c0_g1~~TRINITY_DN5739_c0_g1_i10.p2  ORF type:complete len:174 (+),score=26.31 TRINITY_DN5739_c0_g1_i10:364-885(+)
MTVAIGTALIESTVMRPRLSEHLRTLRMPLLFESVSKALPLNIRSNSRCIVIETGTQNLGSIIQCVARDLSPCIPVPYRSYLQRMCKHPSQHLGAVGRIADEAIGVLDKRFQADQQELLEFCAGSTRAMRKLVKTSGVHPLLRAGNCTDVLRYVQNCIGLETEQLVTTELQPG